MALGDSPDSPPDLSDPLIGTVLADRYRVLRKLGEGGMGAVYLAEHVVIEKKIALKILSSDLARRADVGARFLQEARSASRIGHENVIDISDYGRSPDGLVYIAMEFLDGVDLGKTLQDSGPLPWSRAKGIVLQICRALRAAHDKGIVHRDMKPENIFLLQREGRPDFIKLLDFGIAKVMGSENAPRLTRTGMIFGTPEYMAPEQAEGKDADHRVDVYAVGCVIYHLVTGEPPFRSASFMATLTKHLLEDPVPPSVRRPDLPIPAALDALVLKALEKDREARWQSMTIFMEAVRACGEGDPGTPAEGVLQTRELGGAAIGALRPATGAVVDDGFSLAEETDLVSRSPRRLSTRVLAAVGLLLGAGAAVWWFMSTPPDPAPAAPAAASAPRQPVEPSAVAVPSPALPAAPGVPESARPPSVPPAAVDTVAEKAAHKLAPRARPQALRPAPPGTASPLPTKAGPNTPPELKPFPQ